MLVMSAIILMVPAASKAHAYTTECGSGWASNLSIGYTNQNMSAVDQTAVGYAIADWNDVPATLLMVSGNGGNPNHIQYYTVNNLNPDSYLGETVYGCSGGSLVSALVYLYDYPMHYFFFEDRQWTVAHETGHALGLWHSSDQWALMYPTDAAYANYNIFVPVFDDINGVQAMYGTTATTPEPFCFQWYGSCIYTGGTYPIGIQVTTADAGHYAFVTESSSALHLPSSNSMVMYAIITQDTLYRSSLGVYTAATPYDTTQRFMTVETDAEGFKMVCSGSNAVTFSYTPQTVQPLANIPYFMILVVESGQASAGYAYYKNGNPYGSTYPSLAGWGSIGLCSPYSTSTSVYFGNGVWSDSTLTAASSSTIYSWWDYKI
jgi:hypothetical protein